MANYYEVAGGNGNWNSSTNWASTSGGASGAGVPTSVDNVFFDSHSGNIGVNTTSLSCANLDFTGYTGTITTTNILTVNGTVLTFSAGMTIVTSSGYFILGGSSTTITTNGLTIPYILCSVTATYTLADNLNIGTLNLGTGGITYTFNGNN